MTENQRLRTFVQRVRDARTELERLAATGTHHHGVSAAARTFLMSTELDEEICSLLDKDNPTKPATRQAKAKKGPKKAR